MKPTHTIIAALLLIAAAAYGRGSMSSDEGSGQTVLFFHADWCPLCRADMREIDSRLNELGTIMVVVVDYDRCPELKKRYGITYQHTYVQIDGEGNKIALWNGGGVDGILENVVRGGM